MTLTIAHKPCTPERLHEKTVNVLNAIFEFAGYDLRNGNTVYDGRTREQTVTEAQQTRRDVLDELHLRADIEFHCGERRVPIPCHRCGRVYGCTCS